MRNANSRRGQTSITHLMNFSLPPRPQDHRNTMHRGTRRGNIYGIGSGHHSSDKARYGILETFFFVADGLETFPVFRRDCGALSVERMGVERSSLCPRICRWNPFHSSDSHRIVTLVELLLLISFLGTSTQITDSLSNPMESINSRLSTLINIWTGTTSYRFLHPLSHRKPPVQYVSRIPLLHEWQNVVIYFAYHV